MPSVLNQENICRSEIPWDSRGVDKSNPEHADYLQNTVETFKSEVIRLINANLGKRRKHHTDTGKIILYNLHTVFFFYLNEFFILYFSYINYNDSVWVLLCSKLQRNITSLAFLQKEIGTFQGQTATVVSGKRKTFTFISNEG